MKKIMFALSVLTVSNIVQAVGFDLTDMVPARPGVEVKHQGMVVSKEKVVAATSESEGVETAHHQLIDEPFDDIRYIKVGSGIGILAIGTANYELYNNSNASLLSKRNAYNTAYLAAKKLLVENFEGAGVACDTVATISAEVIDTGNENLANTRENMYEKCMNAVSGSLSGWATYDVYDNVKNNEVRVSIISTPKTRTQIKKSLGALIISSSPEQVFSYIVEDIKKGLTPPVGAKVLTNPETGETYIIGFGSAIIRKNKSTTVTKQLRSVAKKQAVLRAQGALVGTLQGDKVYWEGSFKEEQLKTTEQFFTDPELADPAKAQALDLERSMFLNKITSTDSYSVVTSGKLPPGVTNKTFVSDDGNWIYTISVYAPSLEASSRQAKSEMESGFAETTTSGVASNKSRVVNSYGGLQSGTAAAQGPSGQIADDADF
jgi:hypothetical protein